MAVVMWEEKEQGSSGAESSGTPSWLGRWAQLQPFVFTSCSFEKNTDYFSRCRLAFPSVPNYNMAQDVSQAPHSKAGPASGEPESRGGLGLRYLLPANFFFSF